MTGSDSISPTAHYTGYVWARHGLSHPELTTIEGRVLFESLRPLMTAARLSGRPSLEPYLLARHRGIDLALERAMSERGITQVIEVAAGLSPRGWRFRQRHPELVYVETDLPGMTERKRAALERMGALSADHRVRELDILSEQGLAGLASELDPERGLAVITEGLLSYLPAEAVQSMWQRLANVLGGFRAGIYVSDMHVGYAEGADAGVFRLLLSAFVRGRVSLHFETREDVVSALLAAGFAGASVTPAAELLPDADGPGGKVAHVLEAWTE